MNAKFNASIDAKDYFKWSIRKIDSTQLEDFTKMLPILIPIDSNQTSIAKVELDEVIRLTSLVAERHSNSRYLDESYLLLGKARLYKGDFINATEVFKYLNSNNNSEEIKQQGLIWLMRSYIESKDYLKAEAVSKEVSQLTLYKKNKADYYEVKAAFHQKNNELALAAAYLEESLKYMKKSTKKARAHYIAGQMYSSLQRGSLARTNWLKVVKNKPTYDLEFNAGIELLMLGSKLGENANAVFLKMLEDRKNVDLKDKIYFKMAESKAKKGNYTSAVKDFSKSANLATNANQKASAYLKIAEIYHLNIQDYELASAYYDSTLININSRTPGYEEISQKANSLADFVKFQRVLHLEDSLQSLAAMNPLALESKIEQLLRSEETEKKRISDEAAKMVETKKNEARSGNTGSSNPNKWFFYDQVSLTRSRSEFIRDWGNRALEDNWRRKDKEMGKISFQIERGIETEEEKEIKNTEELENKENAKQMAEFEAKKAAMIGQIPNTAVRLAQSKRRQEEAYYQLGKIYRLQFNEIENARKTFETLLAKFPETQYEQESLYFLALMADNKDSNVYRERLISKYPLSSYARQLKRGILDVNATTESNAERDYEDLFNEYQNGNLVVALDKAEKGLYDYTGTSIEDKFAMLRIILLAKNNKESSYKIALSDFMRSYPSSDLAPKVSGMLKTISKN
jgi:tetratricopeptide (TPR) repeat protein